MEEKLFWVGILVGMHFFLTQHFRDKNKFEGKAAFTRLWHSVFMALLGFVGGALLAVSLDNRSGEVVAAVLFSARQLGWGLAAAVVLGFYAFFKGVVHLVFGKTAFGADENFDRLRIFEPGGDRLKIPPGFSGR